jgi:NADH:ubiquinone oxidoreductase subunit 3 (subunit A)
MAEGQSSTATGESRTPQTAETSGYGITVTILGAALLALAYYGVVAIQEGRMIGEALPEPFYLLAVAFLFVMELLNSRHLGSLGFLRAIAFAVIYGALFVFAVEGGQYLWEDPSIALEGYVGITVLAVALVAAALVYVGYLSVVETRAARAQSE